MSCERFIRAYVHSYTHAAGMAANLRRRRLISGPGHDALVRYRTNDATYEGLGELLISNPTGILVERDELTSLLRIPRPR